MVNVELVNKVYEGEQGEEGRVVRWGKSWIVETRTTEVEWNTLATEGEVFSTACDACDALEEILNNK